MVSPEYLTLEVLVGLACCLGNLLVVWAVWLDRSLRQPTFCFVVSLAVADFLVGAVGIPMAIWADEGLSSFEGCLFICCVLLVLTQSSVLSLLGIAVDRYLRVRIPLRYKILATQRRSWVAVVLSWIVACVLGLTPLLGWHKPKQATAKNQTHTVYKFIDVIDMSYMVYFNFFGCILVPLLAMLLLYVHLFQDIRRHLRENMAGGKENSTYYLKERKLAQSLALVLMLFAICWLPLHVMNSLLHIQNVDIPTIAFHAGILLSHANSAVNPIVYAFKIHKFKRAYLLIWRRYVLCRKEDAFETDRSADNFASSIPRTLAMVTE